MVKAAVLYNFGEALKIEALKLRAPGPDEVVVKLAASGVCHSDLSVQQAKLLGLLDELKGKIAKVEIQCSVPGARVLIRQQAMGTTPFKAAAVNAGPARIEVLAEGFTPFVADVTLTGGGTQVVEAELVRVDFRPAPQSPGYERFDGGKRLDAAVRAVDGSSWRGRIHWDQDERFNWETLDGEDGGVEYRIPFIAIRSIARWDRRLRASVLSVTRCARSSSNA